MAFDTIDPAKSGLLFFDLLNAYFRGADEATQRKMEPLVSIFLDHPDEGVRVLAADLTEAIERARAVTTRLTMAARLGPASAQAVLAHAVTALDPVQAKAALHAVLSAKPFNERAVARMDPLVAALLDHSDEGVSVLAAELANAMIP